MPQPLKQSIPPELVAASKKMSYYPLDNFSAYYLTQGFGINLTPWYKELNILGHNGHDIRAQRGTPLYSIFDEITIVKVQSSVTFGNNLWFATNAFSIPGFEGEYRLFACYGHLQKFAVREGQKIIGRQIIAYSNNTGKYTTGDHLHLGIYLQKKINGVWDYFDWDNGFNGALDPEYFYPDKSYQILPVDYRYGLPVNAVNRAYGELYKKAITPWLKSKLKRMPTSRELNAFAYGRWSFEEVVDPSRYNYWTNQTRDEFYKQPYPRPLGL